jgi:hypothetical protein
VVQIVRFCALERPVAERISRQQKIRKIQARSCDVKELWSRGTGPQGGPFRVASLGLVCLVSGPLWLRGFRVGPGQQEPGEVG